MRTSKTGTIHTVLGTDVSLEGKLQFEGVIRIDGGFKGTVASKEGRLIVGEKSVVVAEIHVDTIIVAGKVHGHIYANRSIEIQKTGRVVGNIEAPLVTIDTGALFDGNCLMRPQAGQDGKTVDLVPQKTSMESS